jgi:hypothetical protein
LWKRLLARALIKVKVFDFKRQFICAAFLGSGWHGTTARSGAAMKAGFAHKLWKTM